MAAHALPRPRARHRRKAAPDAGTSTVELVITMPALLLAVLTVIQFGLWVHAQHVAQAAARDAAAFARTYNGTEQAARERAEESLDSLGPTILRAPTVDVARTTDEALVTVTVTGRAASVLGIFALPVREQAREPVERFVPVSGPGAAR